MAYSFQKFEYSLYIITLDAKTSQRMNGSFGIAPPYNIFVLHAVTAMMVPRKYGHLNGVSLAGRCWPNIECLFGTFVAS